MHTLHLPHWPMASMLRVTARTLAGVWALFWFLYGLPFQGITVGHTLVPPMLPGLCFLALFLIAWKWEFAGGSLMILVALNFAVYYPLYLHGTDPSSVTLATLGLTLPPLIAGLMFLCAWGDRRTL